MDEHLGYAKGLIDQFVEMSPEGEVELRAGTQKQRYRGNWKMQVENAVDNYHASFVHQAANNLMKARRRALAEWPFSAPCAAAYAKPVGG